MSEMLISPVARVGDSVRISELAAPFSEWSATSLGACVSRAVWTCAEEGQFSSGPGATVTSAAWIRTAMMLACTWNIVAALGRCAQQALAANRGVAANRLTKTCS